MFSCSCRSSMQNMHNVGYSVCTTGKHILTTNPLQNINHMHEHFDDIVSELTYKFVVSRIDLTINGSIFNALIDSGASISVINKNIYNSLNEISQIEKIESDIDTCTLANNQSITIIHMAYLYLHIGTRKIQNKFYILKS